MGVFRRFLLTLSYVTSLPIKLHPRVNQADFAPSSDANVYDDTAELAGLAKYLPAAGLLIGIILVGITAVLLFKLHAPNLVTGPIIAIIWLCLTGGLHFDGLMDAADGVFSHRNRERMLEIMMDSRVGNFGAITGMAVLILKCATLASLVAHPLILLGTLAIVPAWARWCELYAIARFPYAREMGKGKIWHDSTRFPEDLLLGIALPVVATAMVATFVGLTNVLPVVAFVLASGLAASHWLASHIKGHTGDTYGAVVELAETGCLILVSTIML
ncbi:MAG: adenosylcobinamide-GDP ribazoletransferase [Candidatus Melainabacteria bacterium]|nr:adenosylcobinamide-GDP ribazoletransferase [Candidatus Melainabacteria bacterium]